MCRRTLYAFGLPLLLAACLAARGATVPAVSRPLRIATWNMEWLVAPTTARDARSACRDGRVPPLPCDVAQHQSRDSADLARLAAYVERLDADIIAFQEVQDEAIARRVFRGYRICLWPGPGVQHVGFALRGALATGCGQPLATLTADGRGRAGLHVTVSVPGPGAIELLVIHLKSGCARDPLTTASEACQLLAAQARELGRWIAARATAGAHFIVLGDFNRAGPPDSADPFWALLDPATFQASSSIIPFANCSWGAPYREFIDHILVSRNLASRVVPGSWGQLLYTPRDTARYHLSDHCPLRVSLNVSPAL